MKGIIININILNSFSWTTRKIRTSVFHFFIILLFTVFKNLVIAQTATSYLSTPNKKAQEAFDKSTRFFAEKNYELAHQWANETLKIDSTFAEAYLRKAQLAEIQTQYEGALEFYRKAVALRPDAPAFTIAYQKLIEHHLRASEYSLAKTYLEKYLPLLKPSSLAHKRAQRQLESALFAEKAINNPLVINPEDLSDTVNAQLLQYFPSLTADGETLLMTALTPETGEDLFVTQYKEGHWSWPRTISNQINTPDNEGTGALSADGRTLVFTACNRRDGYGSCDLYISRRVAEQWQKPQNLGAAVNTHFWESQPALSADGRILYFSSDRQGGIGGRDIWYSTWQANGTWTPARNLGATINTTEDEVSPFLHGNGHTLFFASVGHLGMGGLDLFFSDSTATGWQTPQNLGYPINTGDNQVALVITADNRYGYYSIETKRFGTQRSSRIYRFLLPDVLKKKFVAANYLKGIVSDAKTQKPIKADIELIDLKTNKTVQQFGSDATTGQYLTTLPNGADWGLYVSAEGYFYKSLAFEYSQKNQAEGFQIDVQLQPLNREGFGVLSNIYFDTGKADLQEKSRTELDKLVQLLQRQPQLRIEIAGHTDDVGDAKQNQLLSQRRAQSVVDYLTKAQISASRIKAIGLGEAKPIAPNTSEQNRQLNRRIEWRLW